MKPRSKAITVIETPVATVWLEPGVLCYSPKDVERTAANVEENYAIIRGLIKEPVIWLLDLTVPDRLDISSRQFISTHITKLCSELVIIADSTAASILAIAFKRMESDAMTVSVFDSEAKARSYIETRLA